MSHTKDVLGQHQSEITPYHMADDSSWLSASVATTPFFIIPSPALQSLLEKIGIARSSTTGQFYFTSMPFLVPPESKSCVQTPWAVAHSAQKRCKHVEKLISSMKTVHDDVVRELRSLALVDTDNGLSNLSSFMDLLNPLLTESPDFQLDMPTDDVLVLFGSPATIFQILLFAQSLSSSLTDLVLELVATNSPFAQRLLEQFRQPVGLYAMFTTKEAFEDTAARFLDLFKIVQDPRIQAAILAILPDLATSQQASSLFLNEEDRSRLVLQLIDLLDTLPVSDSTLRNGEIDPIVCLIECLVSFSVQNELADRLHSSFFTLLDRCYGSASYFNYLTVISRCLLINGPSIPRNSPELFKLISKLRQYFCFPKRDVTDSITDVNTALISVLQTSFQFDHNIVTEWIRAISSSCTNTGSSSLLQEIVLNPDQAIQDMLVLVVAYSTVTRMTVTSTGNVTCEMSLQRGIQQLISGTFKRLVITGHFLTAKSYSEVMETIFENYGNLLLSGEHGIFPSFLCLLDQLIVAGTFGRISSSSLNRKIGFTFLAKAFCSKMADILQQKEILAHLSRHISYDLSNETISPVRRLKFEGIIRSGLISFLYLAQLKPNELATFDEMICGIQKKIDFLESSYSNSMVIGCQNSIIPQLMDIRYTFLIMASIAFNIRENRKLQEDLLAVLRKQLSDQSLFSKCVGLIGAVVVLEVLCRRETLSSFKKQDSANHVMTGEDESIILASQLIHLNEDRPSTSTINTSRSSNASCLSLRGPGTTIADDPNEVNLLAEEDRAGESSVNSTHAITPPSRLLLQLVGLVEHAIKSHEQLVCFWFDQLASCFTRFIQLKKKLDDTRSDLSHAQTPEWPICLKQAHRLLTWMAARIMRDFQVLLTKDHFVFDNAPVEDCVTQFALHDNNLCEISIGLGPLWSRFNLYSSNLQTQPCSSRSIPKSERIPCPSLVSAQLNLLSIAEAALHDGHLDGIDALVGCPLLLPDNWPNRYCSTQTQVVSKLNTYDPRLIIFTINWFIEAINAFAPILISYCSLHTEDISISASDPTTINANCSFITRRDSILIRISQIANLRHRLYKSLIDLTSKTGTIFESNEDPIHPITDQGPLNLHCQLPLSSQSTDNCLPTATFEPNPIFNIHSRTNQSRESKQFCFDCGIHLISKSEDSSSSKKGLSKPSKSKCASQSNSKRPKLTKKFKKRKFKSGNSSQQIDIDDGQDHDEECTIGGDQDLNDDSLDSLDDNSNDEADLKDKDCIGKSKMALICSKKSKRDNAMVSPSLIEISACFRELDLHLLTIGLSEWPWVIRSASKSETRNSSIQLANSNPDWSALDWLMEDFNLKLDHMSGIPAHASSSWTAFHRLDNLSHDLKRTLLIHLVPHVYRALGLAMNFLSEHKIPGNGNSILSSSSSDDDDDDDDGEDDNDNSQIDKPSKEKISKSTKVSQTPHSSPRCLPDPEQVSNTLCLCLRSLFIMISDLTNPLRALDRGDFTFVDMISPLGYLASRCVQSLSQACCSTGQHYMREVFTNSNGTLRHDSIEDGHIELDKHLVISGYNSDSMTFVDVLDKTTNAIDGFNETNHLENANYSELANALKIILQWFLQTSPNSLPHAPAALMHCRLVDLLATLHHACQVKVPSSMSTDENLPWTPDLFNYTKLLLDQDWDPNVKWKGYSYRESLQGLLSVHLRSQYNQNINDSSSSLIDTLVDFTRGLLVPFVRHYQICRGLSESKISSTKDNWFGYRTLNDQTIDIYCREVMETILWFTKQLCIYEKTISNGMAPPHLTESFVLAQWNQCIEVLCSLTGFFHTSSKTGSHSGRHKLSHAFLSHILPSMMRTGRLFLETLLKGAMPLLNNLFRHRGVEVTTFLRNTQQLTRFLQRVCTHAKAYQNSQLTNQIPATRRCLETFVYRVKVMLSQNQCAEAFWLGTLKNRDLHGVELADDSIQSQASDQTSDYSQSLTEISNRVSDTRSGLRKSSIKDTNSKSKQKNKQRCLDSVALDANIEGDDYDSNVDIENDDEYDGYEEERSQDRDCESERNDNNEQEEDEDEEEEEQEETDDETEDDLIEPSDTEV